MDLLALVMCVGIEEPPGMWSCDIGLRVALGILAALKQSWGSSVPRWPSKRARKGSGGAVVAPARRKWPGLLSLHWQQL